MLSLILAAVVIATSVLYVWQFVFTRWDTSAPAPASSSPIVGIIGMGHGGICLATKLRRAGIRFTILEKSEKMGGTWRDNTYPGCACDVPSFLYSYSFAPNIHWSRKWVGQREILRYLEHVVQEFDLLPNVVFGVEVGKATFDLNSGLWHVRDKSGKEVLQCNVLVSGVGQLSQPNVPRIEGMESFSGEWWHTARYRHDVQLTNKRVAVIGSGASAIQLVPELAYSDLKELYVFQRTPSYIADKGDYEYPSWAYSVFQYMPLFAYLHRVYIYWWLEINWWLALKVSSWFNMSEKLRKMLVACMERAVVDPELRKAVIPTYPVGCKRILISDDFLPAIQRENVKLVPERVSSVRGNTVITPSGQSHDVDILIFATGFRSNDFVAPMDIVVRSSDGEEVNLVEQWGGEPRAYLGMANPVVPNFFLLYVFYHLYGKLRRLHRTTYV